MTDKNGVFAVWFRRRVGWWVVQWGCLLSAAVGVLTLGHYEFSLRIHRWYLDMMTEIHLRSRDSSHD